MITRRDFLKGLTFVPIAAVTTAAVTAAVATERPHVTWEYGNFYSFRFYEGPITPVPRPRAQWQKLNRYYGMR